MSPVPGRRRRERALERGGGAGAPDPFPRERGKKRELFRTLSVVSQLASPPPQTAAGQTGEGGAAKSHSGILPPRPSLLQKREFFWRQKVRGNGDTLSALPCFSHSDNNGAFFALCVRTGKARMGKRGFSSSKTHKTRKTRKF